MHPTSAAQFGWRHGDELPRLEPVRAGLWSLGMEMPDGHIHYSLAYLIADENDAIHIVDSGWGTDQNWARLTSALAELGRTTRDVASITITHQHADHLGLAGRLRDESGAPVALHAIEQSSLHTISRGARRTAELLERLGDWGVPADVREEIELDERDRPTQAPQDLHSFSADILLADDDMLDIPGWHLSAMRTPGHTPGHVCLRDDRERLLFTGDHVLPTIFPGLGLGGRTATNAMADYLESLDAVAAFDDHEVLPGHGYRFTGLAGRCERTAKHHLRRSREVLGVLTDSPSATIWEIAARATWSAGWENLQGFYVVSALRQIAMHVEFVQSEAGARRLAQAAA